MNARHPSPRETGPLSPWKKRLFTAITVIVPVVLFLLVESGLRIYDYGGEYRLIRREDVAGREMYRVNRRVARRYFTGSSVVVPEPADDAFAITKPPRTKRVFFLGESTMAGFPYDFHATAPSFLGDRLRALFPRDTIEIVNLGISAVGSYVVADLIGELTAYEPDLLVIYLGHNEFYGVYGVGSSVSAGGRPWMNRLALRLLHLKTFLLLRDGYLRARENFRPAGPGGDVNLMGQMVGNQSIPFGSETYRVGLDAYRANLNSIIETAAAARVPLLFSTLVSNIRDQPPFRDAGPESASVHYRRGRELADGGRFDSARMEMTLAKDLDGLRFRATEEFQQALLSTCAVHGVPVARVDSVFRANSVGGLVGNNLILEHLHPNIGGYFLMAKTWADAIVQAGLLGPRQALEGESFPSDAELRARSTVSAFDSLAGAIKISILTRRWPFVGHDDRTPFVPRNPVEEAAFAYVQKKLSWSDARYRLTEYYASVGRFEDARRECRAIARVLSRSYQPLLRIADLYRMEGRNSEAFDAYLRCVDVEDNPYARIKTAIILLEREQPDRAADQLRAAFRIANERSIVLSRESQAGGHYLLGVSLAKLGEFAAAREELGAALAINPSDREARDLLARLPR
jgi:tetratricopeptide (TPR) repeat protein